MFLDEPTRQPFILQMNVLDVKKCNLPCDFVINLYDS